MAEPASQHPGPIAPAYAYRCVDRSRLTALISTHIAPRVEPWLPTAWSANAVTWVGSLLMWLLLAGVLLCPAPLRDRLAPLWVALLWTYCLLDHVDGCRARRRGTSSARGEFLDHALDAWHTGIVVIVVGAMGGQAVRPAIVVAALACAGLATAVTWLEQKLRGEFTLAPLGPVEAVFAAGVYVLLWSWLPARPWLRATPLPALGLTTAEWVALAAAAGCLATVGLAWWRSRALAPTIGALALTLGLAALAGRSPTIGWVAAGAAVAIGFAEYSTRIITSHLARTAMPWPDAIGATLLAIGAFLPVEHGYVAGLALAWLGGRAALSWALASRRLAPARLVVAGDLALNLD